MIARPFDGCRAILDGRASAADRPVLEKDTMGNIFGKIDAKHGVHLGTDHNAPPCRAVGSRDGFDHLQIGAAVDFETAQDRRHHEVEHLRVKECLYDRRRQIPLALCAWRFLAHECLQRESPRHHVPLLCHVALLPVLST
jgi:hypothetical protein